METELLGGITPPSSDQTLVLLLKLPSPGMLTNASPVQIGVEDQGKYLYRKIGFPNQGSCDQALGQLRNLRYIVELAPHRYPDLHAIVRIPSIL